MALRYRDIIQKAAATTWRHKFLWFFGLFAALTSNGEEYDSLFRNTSWVTDLQQNATDIRDLASDGRLQEVWRGFTSYLSDNALSSIGVVFAFVVIAFFAVWLIIVSQVALISAAAKKEKNQTIDLVDGFWSGNKLFGPVLGVNAIALAVLYGSLLVIGLPLLFAYFGTGATVYLTLLVVLAFLILVPANIVISFITKFAAAYVIIERQPIGIAIRKGWRLFLKNWLVSLETAFILFLINFVLSLFIIGALGISGLPVTNQIGFLIYFFISAILGSLLATFQYTTWTYLFLELTQRTMVSKLIRWFDPRSVKRSTGAR